MVFLHKNTFHIISHWKQAKLIQDTLIKMYISGSNIPRVNNEWYVQQDMIEWHNLEEANWKKHINDHLRDIRKFDRMHYKNGISLVMVLWNAQLLLPYQYYIWKDLPGDVVVHMVSTKYMPFVRDLGFYCQKYTPHAYPELKEKLKKPMLELLTTQKDWRKILIFRDELIAYLDWNDSLVALKQSLQEIILEIQPECIHQIPDILTTLSNANDKLAVCFAAEYCLMAMYYLRLNGKHRLK